MSTLTKAGVSAAWKTTSAVIMPYWPMAKGIVVVLAICALWFWIGRAKEMQVENTALKVVVHEAAKNKSLNTALLRQVLREELAVKQYLQPIYRDVSRERPPVDPSCAPALHPIYDALDGLRDFPRPKTSR